MIIWSDVALLVLMFICRVEWLFMLMASKWFFQYVSLTWWITDYKSSIKSMGCNKCGCAVVSFDTSMNLCQNRYPKTHNISSKMFELINTSYGHFLADLFLFSYASKNYLYSSLRYIRRFLLSTVFWIFLLISRWSKDTAYTL